MTNARDFSWSLCSLVQAHQFIKFRRVLIFVEVEQKTMKEWRNWKIWPTYFGSKPEIWSIFSVLRRDCRRKKNTFRQPLSFRCDFLASLLILQALRSPANFFSFKSELSHKTFLCLWLFCSHYFLGIHWKEASRSEDQVHSRNSCLLFDHEFVSLF